MIKNIKKIILAILLALAVNINLVSAAANFQVASFSCSPTEVVINSAFSCTATIQNTGDASGTLNTATLYPDSNDWLENSNYPQSYGQSVNAGNSISVTFTGLRSTKSGNNGFARIMLDSVTDTYVADNNKKVNVINVAVTVSNSASSAAMGGSVTSTAEVTAGGNIDVSLSFTSNSGGCSIGSQTNPKTISGMTDGSKQSRTFTITQGTSGNCQFTISASATGSGGVATKIDSTSSTITCTNCPSGSSGSSSSGGSGTGSGGGGSVTKTYEIGQLTLSQMLELLDGEKASFEIFGENHTLTLKNHTNTSAVIVIESEKQTFTMNLNDEINVDLNSDKTSDILVKLKEINPATNKVTIIISPISQGSGSVGAGPGEPVSSISESIKEIGKLLSSGKTKIIIYVMIALIIIAIISGAIYFMERKKRKRRWGER